MSESRKPIDSALDVFVFLPVGVAITAAEELPKIAAKGRERVTNQITVARVVGQFAITRGRAELEKRWSLLTSNVSGPSPPSRPAPVPGDRAEPDFRSDYQSEAEVTFDDLLGGVEALAVSEAARSADPASAAYTNGTASLHVVGTGPVSGGIRDSASSPGPKSDVAGLAIPGYDSLSASQVVQRLAGLSSEELEAVGAYEAGHRARRTVLTRVTQLQGS